MARSPSHDEIDVLNQSDVLEFGNERRLHGSHTLVKPIQFILHGDLNRLFIKLVEFLQRRDSDHGLLELRDFDDLQCISTTRHGLGGNPAVEGREAGIVGRREREEIQIRDE